MKKLLLLLLSAVLFSPILSSAQCAINAGNAIVVCAGSTISLQATAVQFTSFNWSIIGTGTISTLTSLNPVYTPSAADITAGTVTFTVSGTGGGCANANSSVVATILPLPTITAGTDQTVCASTPISLGATMTNASTINWTKSGTGTFSNQTITNPVYTPSTGDIIAGTVTLTATAVSSGACTASDQVIINFLPSPTINAGADQTACVGSTTSINATLSSGATIVWSAVGIGTLSNFTTPTPSFTSTVAGSVTLTASASMGSCTTSDQVILTILPPPTITAGPDQTACAGTPITLAATMTVATVVNWTTNGSGTFSNQTTTNPVYTPSVSDITAGTVTLTATAITSGACSVSDQIIINLLPLPTINAGLDQTACVGSTIPLNATLSSGTTLAWTAAGVGTFSNITSPTATFTSSVAGSITLTATAAKGSCTALDQVILTILPLPTINVGADQTACAGSTIPLNATMSGGATLNWTTSGSGMFSNKTTATTTYIPSTTDATAGTITLTATVISGAACASADNLIATILHGGILNAGPDQFITSGSASLTGTATNVTTVEWKTNGTGTFSNATSLSTTYTPSATDIANGIVKIKLTSTDNAVCTATANELLLSIGTDFSITGTVNAAANTLDKGVVLLFKQETTGLRFITSDTILPTDAGVYTFNHTPAGTYVLLASPTTGSSMINTFLPTYSGGVLTWNTAQSFTISSNSTRILQLIPYVSADPNWNSGTDIISGLITVSENAFANARTTLSTVPAAYVTVYLTNNSGNKITYTQTDAYGRYTFNNVKAGSYKVEPEFVGTALPGAATSVPVVVDGLASTVEDGSMSLEERSSATTGITNAKSFSLATYPNPTSNTISFDIVGNNTTGMFKLLDQTGNIQLQKEIDLNQPSITINVETLPAGVYLLQVTTANEVYTSKVIKY